MTVRQVEVIALQRQTLDWHQLSMPEFREQSRTFCRLWSKPEDYVFRLAELWNSTFSVDYLTARGCLKDIALNNVGAIPDVSFVPYAEYTNVPDRHGFYVPMDDDDWLSPAIAATLAACDPEQHALVLWRSANIGSPQQVHPVFIWGLNGRCMTNNYAISSVWMNHLQQLPQVIQHKGAMHMLEKLRSDGADVVQLDCALSVSNKSPVSSVSLDNGLAGHFSSARLAKLVQEYLQKMDAMIAADIAWIPWAAQPLADTVALFHRVLASQK